MPRKFDILSEEIIYQDDYTTMMTLRTQADKKKIEKHPRIIRNPYVIVVPVTPSRRTVLIQQYRFAIAEFVWEFPGGGIDDQEDAREAAIRELYEETGIEADDCRCIAKVQPNAAVLSNPGQIFIAHITDESLDQISFPKNEDQINAHRVLSISELDKMIQDGDVICGLTLTAYGLFYRYMDWR